MKRPAISLLKGRPTKRIRLCGNESHTHGVSLHMRSRQQEEQLGPLWWDVSSRCSSRDQDNLVQQQEREQEQQEQQIQQPALMTEVSCSLGTWVQQQQAVSVSLAGNCSRSADEEDTQDTANSSSSSDSSCAEPPQHHTQHAMEHGTSPAAAAAGPDGEEDSITSAKHKCSPAFSFGLRPIMSPDLSIVQGWHPAGGILDNI